MMTKAHIHYMACTDQNCEKYMCVARRDYESEITKLKQQNARLVEVLKAVGLHGLGHFEDCAELGDDELPCTCGCEETSALLYKTLAEHKAEHEGQG